MVSKKRSIDLLNPINPPADIWTTIYNWVFKVGRYILVSVEALLLIVFFARFTMDEINNNLTEEINDRVDILSNSEFRAQEIRYRNIHLLLGDVKEITGKQKINSAVIAEITSAVPTTLTLDKFTYNNDKVSLAVKSTDLKAIKDYEFSLRQNTQFKDVVVTLSKSGTNSNDIDVGVSFLIVDNQK